jgi:hypothetical protein
MGALSDGMWLRDFTFLCGISHKDLNTKLSGQQRSVYDKYGAIIGFEVYCSCETAGKCIHMTSSIRTDHSFQMAVLLECFIPVR